MKQAMIKGQPLDRFLAEENQWRTITRGELADLLALFIDKATFAQAMDSLDKNLKIAIQGAVLTEIGNLMVVEEGGEQDGEVSEGGIHLPPGAGGLSRG